MEDMIDDLFSVFRGTDDPGRVRTAKDGRLAGASAGDLRRRSNHVFSSTAARSAAADASLRTDSSKSVSVSSFAARRTSHTEEAEAGGATSAPAAAGSSAAVAAPSVAATGVKRKVSSTTKKDQAYSDAADETCNPAASVATASRTAAAASSGVKQATPGGESAGKNEDSINCGGRTISVEQQQQTGRKKQKRGQEKLKKGDEEEKEDAQQQQEAVPDSSRCSLERSGRLEHPPKRPRLADKSTTPAAGATETSATAAGAAAADRTSGEGGKDEDGKLAAFLLAEKEEEKKQSGLVVETLASDDNCLHEVVRPAGCPLRFVYYPFETTEMKVSTSASCPTAAADGAADTAAAASSSSSSLSAETCTAAAEENAAAAGAAGAPPDSEAAAAAPPHTVIVSTETVSAAAEGRSGFSKGRGDGDEREAVKKEKEEEEDDILKRYGPRPDHLPAAAARVYKFKLDTFQQRSVLALEAGENVLIAAHTSAGKTVVAEYAIAMSLRDEQRVVYTSPIKALSNQKYRDFCELFGSSRVGLLTGDVTLQPHAPVLVMTTEILRSMLYRGSSLLHAIKWVIFDEIHYMRDRERGVVWEESIILLPCSVNLVFLSATIPNAREFAAWITHLKQQPCHLFFTDYRPTPLQHYLFPAGGDGVYLVVDEKKKFREENFHKALATLNDAVEEQALQTNQQRQRRARAARTVSNVKKIVLMCHARNYTPVIVFCFSKRECEAHATMLLPPAAAGGFKGPRGGAGGGDAVDLTTPEEKQLIEEVFNNALETLEEEDRQLPQVKSILPLLKRGIGIHHGGLLPFIKEIIEILFQESLVRVLFSTETFSMGVNMPAKTVVFTAIRKWDGQEYRIINSGEYIQMAGRAGRRGLDDRGIVIIMLDEQVDPEEAKQLFLGQAAPLLSTFHLGFNMLLNLFRIEDADPLFMITRSFAYFQRNRKAMQLEQQQEELEEELARAANIHALVDLEPEEKEKLDFDVETSIREYYELKHDLATFGKELQQICMHQQHIVRFLQAGRILRIVEEDGTDWGWAPCVSKVRRQLVASTNAYEGPAEVLLVECLVCCSSASAAAAAAAEAKETAAAAVPEASKRLNGEKLLLQRLKLRPAFTRVTAAAAQKNGGGRAAAGKSEGKNEVTATGTTKNEAAEDYVLKVLPFPITSIRRISKCRMVLPAGVDINTADARRAVHFQLQKVIDKFEPEGGLPVLDPIQDMKIEEPRAHGLVALLAEKEMRLMANPFYEHPLCQTYYDAHHRRVQMETKLREVRDALDGQKQLVMKEQLRAMRRVLRRLEFLDANDIVTMKGRVACEITTADELVAAELLFQNVFEKMEVEVICAVLSCLVFEEKHEEVEPADEVLLAGLEKVREVARHIASVYVESRYTDSNSSQQHPQVAGAAADSGEAANKAVEDYVNKFQHAMMSLTYRWAKGESFASIISDTCLYEGTVIRCMRRLEELMRQMACASKTVGNVALEKTFLEGIKKIRRGIVFSSSLYL